MRGVNNITMSGNVGEIVYGATGAGTQACSFMLASERIKKEPVWVRINVFGPLVQICKTKLSRGGYVIIKGELMNRKALHDDDRMVEVRCEDIVFVPKSKVTDNDNMESNYGEEKRSN